MVDFFHNAGEMGADFISIESTCGKQVNDETLMTAERAAVFALVILGARDMEFLWDEISAACQNSGILPGADTTCGFANTVMVLADQRLIPVVVRVAAVPRSLIVFERGAVCPSKDCAYEDPHLKAIAGVPISIEGRSAACAHLSYVGNIAQAVCDCWSNESVQNVLLISTYAPTISLEQPAYDCRLMNSAARPAEDPCRLRDWPVKSDAATNPQVWVLRPGVVLQIVSREVPWLERQECEAASLPDSEEDFLREIMGIPLTKKFLPDQYGLS